MAKMTLEEFRQKVIVAVGTRLNKHDWFNGVCMDNVDAAFPDLEEAVESAVLDTVYFDAPNHGMSDK